MQYSSAFEKESNFVKVKNREAELVPQSQDPFLSW
jgi:hypothetical protein